MRVSVGTHPRRDFDLLPRTARIVMARYARRWYRHVVFVDGEGMPQDGAGRLCSCPGCCTIPCTCDDLTSWRRDDQMWPSEDP